MMDLPVWVTVIVGRIIGGFVTGFVAGALLASLLITHSTGSGLSQSTTLTYSLVIACAGAVVTGVVTALLLPYMSGCTVAIGTAVLASFVGELVPFVGSAVFMRAALDSHGYSSFTLLAGVSPLLGLGLSAVGVLLTVWMIQSSTTIGGSRRGPNIDLYSRARQTSLDEPPSEL
jgi:hypothetical protein